MQKQFISTANLDLTQIPADTADIHDLLVFAHTFDGYGHWGTRERCAQIANTRDHGSIDKLRSCLFFEARRWRHFGDSPDDAAIGYWRSLVTEIRQRLEWIDNLSPACLADGIRQLPADEAVPANTQGYNQYRTQKDHWLGWLNPDAGTGTYSRSTGTDVTARVVYNRIGEPKMLLWLASASGVGSDLLEQAQLAANQVVPLASRCAAIRKILPWRIVADAQMQKIVCHRAPISPPGIQRPESESRVDPALLMRTAKRWNIPTELAQEVIRRDLTCIYCRQPFTDSKGPARRRASWEHVINDLTLVNASNIALCCVGCNASKGALPLAQWLMSYYCRLRNINRRSNSAVAAALLTGE